LAALLKQIEPLPSHCTSATIAMDSMDAMETWAARRRKLDSSLKSSPPKMLKPSPRGQAAAAAQK